MNRTRASPSAAAGAGAAAGDGAGGWGAGDAGASPRTKAAASVVSRGLRAGMVRGFSRAADQQGRRSGVQQLSKQPAVFAGRFERGPGAGLEDGPPLGEAIGQGLPLRDGLAQGPEAFEPGQHLPGLSQ